jgi:hypothetical protein
MNSTGVVANVPTSYTYKVNNNTQLVLDGLNATFSSNVIVNGNLQVAGIIDSTNIAQNNLMVQDKDIYLAYNSNALNNPSDRNMWVKDGVANDKAGVIVQGCPDGVTQYTGNNEQYFEKSIRWNCGEGIYSKNSNESVWEMKGGSLKITNNNPTLSADGTTVTSSKPVSFQIRINQKAELEIVKYYNNTTSVVAKFGRTPGFTL